MAAHVGESHRFNPEIIRQRIDLNPGFAPEYKIVVAVAVEILYQ